MKGFRIYLRYKNLYYLLMNWGYGARKQEGLRMIFIQFFSNWVCYLLERVYWRKLYVKEKIINLGLYMLSFMFLY